jgi:aminopeptidase N
MKSYLKIFIINLFAFSALAQEPNGASICAENKKVSFARQARLKQAQQVDERIDAIYYKLNLSITYSPQYLKGEVMVGLKSKQNNLDNVLLDLRNNMKADSIKIGNKKLSFSQTNNQLAIKLDKSYNLQESFFLKIYYQGKPETGAFGVFSFGTHGLSKEPAIWSLSEPFGSSWWFPCKDTPADKADSSDVWITMPKFFVSVSNGKLMQVIENQDNTKTYQWQNRYPIAPYLISIACSNYAEHKNYYKYTTKDSMLVHHYIYPEQLNSFTKTQLDETVFMLDLFSKKFGQYPFIKEKYGHASCGFGGGMEHQTCSSMGGYSSGLVAHELAHQWFGDKITCKNWENIWLNEGFASFAEAIYAEAKNGQSAYQSTINNFAQNAKFASGTVYVQNPNDEGSIFNYSRSYAKGAMVLHMLKGIMGEAQFYKALQAYLNSEFAYNVATTEDFQKIVEGVYGQKLDYFFKQWIYGENYPKYTYTWSPKSNTDGTFKLNLKIEQSQNSNPAFFTMPVDIKITNSQGESVVTLFVDKASQTFEIPNLKSIPTAVSFDPENKILKNVTEVKDNVSVLANEETDIQKSWKISPNPADNQFVISYTFQQPFNTQISIFDLKGRIVKNYSDEKADAQTQKIISTEGLSAGKYFVRVGIDGKFSAKILVVR